MTTLKPLLLIAPGLLLLSAVGLAPARTLHNQAFQAQSQAPSKVQYVNPLIGTGNMGHVFPGACVPFGGVQLSPDTEAIPHNIQGKYQPQAYKYCAGYQYSDSTILGFSHTHLSGTGHSDLGDLLLMPLTGEVKTEAGTAQNPREGYRSRFSHATEKASAGYYEVKLQDYDILAQLTATPHAGIHKYTFPKGQAQKLIIDLDHGIYNYEGKTRWANLRIENDTLITGYRLTSGWARENHTYFAIRLSKPIRHYGYHDRAPLPYVGWWRKFGKTGFPEMGGCRLVAWLDMGADDKPLELRVGLSATGISAALKNLDAETQGLTFDQLTARAREAWEKELSAIEATGEESRLQMFYTSLYHTLINPSLYQDVDGRYRGLDHDIHQAEGFQNHTVFSVWDTYRAEHPLLNLIKRERSRDIVESFLTHADQSVHKMLPVWSHMGNENWCMIGYHGVSVVGDALDKGLVSDPARALQAMVTTSNCDYYDHTGTYKKLGYVPFDLSNVGSSITLEYAYDDWVVYRAAQRLGQDSLAAVYARRARNWRNVFDPSLRLARGRMQDGTWKPDFSPYDTHDQGFIEGNSWNYSMYVPHDVAGLMEVMGGDKAFVERLDRLFTEHLDDAFFAQTEDVTREGLLGMYVHGNEPSHHVPYLYMWTSQPYKTQYWVREIMNRMYRPEVEGLCGNDDCGQMSAWYIFSAMGFYPVCPGIDQYVIGAPYFPALKVNLEGGKVLEIKAPGVSDNCRYVRSVKFNGQALTQAYLTYAQLSQGGLLEFEMSSKPPRKPWFSPSARPYSM